MLLSRNGDSDRGRRLRLQLNLWLVGIPLLLSVVFPACLSVRCQLRKLIRFCVQLRGRRMVELGHLSFTLFVLFALFTIKDLFIHSEPDAKEIPITRMVSSTFVGPTLKFLYW
jgi:hypothetical protein